MEKRAAVMGGGKWYLSVKTLVRWRVVYCSVVQSSAVYSNFYHIILSPLHVHIQPSNTNTLCPNVFSIYNHYTHFTNSQYSLYLPHNPSFLFPSLLPFHCCFYPSPSIGNLVAPVQRVTDFLDGIEAVVRHNILTCTVLYCTVLYCTVLYRTVLYCAVL